MVRIDELSNDWRQWSRQDWNTALVRHVFDSTVAGDTSPVRRIDVTDGFLARVTNSADEPAEEVRASLIGRYTLPPDQVRQLYDPMVVLATWSRSDALPPFFGQLFITLLVASASEDTHDEGDFYRRFAATLGLDPSRNYFGHGLPSLWRSLAQWTIDQSQAGFEIRPLLLPDPRHETIIGISKRLAFPGFRDQRWLARVITQAELSTESPVESILNAVGKERRRFSPLFQEEFRVFRDAMRRNEPADDTAFWAAYEAINWSSDWGTGRLTRTPIALTMDVPGVEQARVDVLSRKMIAFDGSQWTTQPLPNAIDDFVGHVVPQTAERDANSTVKALFARDPHLWKTVHGTWLGRAIEQGCLCFGRGESVGWLNRPNVPAGEDVWLLLRDDVAGRTARLLELENVRVDHRNPLPDVGNWELLGQFHSDELLYLREWRPFSEIDAFKRLVGRSQIALKNAIRLDDGVLFLRPALPEIAVENADSVDYFSFAPGGSEPRTGVLERAGSGDSALFHFKHCVEQIAVPGRLVLRANRAGTQIQVRRLELVATCSARVLRQAQRPSDWLVDNGSGQLVPLDDRLETGVVANTLASPDLIRDLASRARASVGPCDASSPPQVFSLPIESLPSAWIELLEVLAGRFACRTGVEVPELLKALQDAFEVEPGTAWELFDSLILNQILERRFTRRWPSQRVFAGSPRIAIAPGRSVAYALGLWAFHRRQRLQQAVAEGGKSLKIAAVGDWSAIGPLQILECGGDDAREIAGIVGDVPVVSIDTPSVPSPLTVLSFMSPRVDPYARGEGSTYWSSRRRKFCLDDHPNSDLALECRRHRRQHSTYILRLRGEPAWATSSRAWASFVADLLISKTIWKLQADGALVSARPVPEPFARRCLANGGLSGTNWKADGSEWIHGFGDLEAAHSALDEWLVARRAPPVPSHVSRWISAWESRQGLVAHQLSDSRLSTPLRHRYGLTRS